MSSPHKLPLLSISPRVANTGGDSGQEEPDDEDLSAIMSPQEEEEVEKKKDSHISFVFIILCVNLFQVGFIIVNSTAKILMNDFDVTPFEFALFRSAFNLCAASAMLKMYGLGCFEGVSSENQSALFMRCSVGTFAFIAVMLVVKLLPLTIFFMIFQTSPFIVALIAWVWLNERISLFEAVAMVCSYVGVAMIGLAKPPVDQTASQIEIETSNHQYTFGIVLSLLCAVGLAIVQTTTRRLKSVNFLVIQFNYALMSTTVCALITAYYCIQNNRIPFRFDTAKPYFMLVGAAIFNFSSQNLMTYSNQSTNPATVGLLSYCGVVYSFLSDSVVFSLTFSSLQLYGVFVVLIFNVLAGVYKIVNQKQKEQIKLKDDEYTKQTN